MIETGRCCIRPTTFKDIPDINALYNDAAVWTYLGGKPNFTRKVRGIISRIFPGNNCLYSTVRSKDANNFFGNISLTPHHDGKHIEISYEFLSKTWGKGYATEAVGAMIGYAFNDLGHTNLVAETQAANVASCTMLRKLGFYEEERLVRFGAEQIIWVIYKEDLK